MRFGTPAFGHFPREAVEEFFGRIKRDVRGPVSEVEEEGIILVFANEGEGCVGAVFKVVSGVLDRAWWKGVSFEVKISNAGSVAVFVIKVVETMAADSAWCPEMPLPDLNC